MAADFTLTAGTHKSLVPVVSDPAGGAFPTGTVFAWAVDGAAATLNDPAAMSPTLTGVTATDPATPLTVTLTVTENGFTHTKSHTVDVIAAAVDTINAVDFSLQ